MMCQADDAMQIEDPITGSPGGGWRRDVQPITLVRPTLVHVTRCLFDADLIIFTSSFE